MKKIERVVYIKNISDLKFWNKKFERIYFGNEFCENLIPSSKELNIALDFSRKRKVSFSLLTCQVNDYFLKKIIKNISLLGTKDEIILNDWGIFNIIRKGFKKLLPNCILGKFLNNNINLTEKTSRTFLKRWGFAAPSLERLEIEIRSLNYCRHFDFISIKNIFGGLKASIYYPYSYFATSRFCPMAYRDKITKPMAYINKFPCERECQKYTVFANPPVKNIKAILKGNTWFTKTSASFFLNKKIPWVRRLVYMPTIPV